MVDVYALACTWEQFSFEIVVIYSAAYGQTFDIYLGDESLHGNSFWG